MSAVTAYWPGMSPQQRARKPELADHAWANWLSRLLDAPEALQILSRMGADALLTFKTGDLHDDGVPWVMPHQLVHAARALRAALDAREADARRLGELYGEAAPWLEEPEAELQRDLSDLEDMALWAIEQGAWVMTLDIG